MEAADPAPLRALTARLKEDDSFRAVAEALRAGRAATIEGAWGSSRSMALAALAESTDRPIIALIAHAAEIDPIVADLTSFIAGRPLVLPALEEAGRRDAPASIVQKETYGRRLNALKAIKSDDPPKIIVTTIAALLQPMPSLEKIAKASRSLRQGQIIDTEELCRWLVSEGWHRRESVELPGEFSLRGGILDLYASDAENPLRVELFGDEIESIREFEISSQRSIRETKTANITALVAVEGDHPQASETMAYAHHAEPDAAHFADVVDEGTWFALLEPMEIQAEGKQYLNRVEDSADLFSVEATWSRLLRHPTVVVASLPYPSVEISCHLHIESVERFSGEVQRVRDEIDRASGSDRFIIACHNQGETQRLSEILAETRTLREGRLELVVGQIAAGFRWVSESLVLVSDDELFHRSHARRTVSKRRYQSRAIDSFIELSPGDYVVHLGHGIGVYRGMKMLDKNDQLEEHLILEFADGVLVYVPASKMDLVQKYVGSGHGAPRLSKVGGLLWERRKKQVQRAVADLAVDLLEVQAARQTQPGYSFPPDSTWMQEFEAAFPFEETPDQITSVSEIKADMQSPKPMDRLLCGDVGYGKTELAIRAAFKAVDSGKQVAVLVPTTVLAQQHLRTFRERMAEYPFTVEALSRFESRSDQKKVVGAAKSGGVDVLIGTHRILSDDVEFQDLGLIIVDEEQRFGVAHKERLKRLRSQVDVLTMTATPIPRTLHSALLGIRDISNLETPPENRLAVETRIIRWDQSLLRHAILRELNRDGQIYFVHNRVHDIGRLADRISAIVPEARIGIVHGQMNEHLIEQRMVEFLEKKTDILLATTIIESGLDIPNANTIFIDEGDRYGLADLHQLRGRVGRSRNRAYCYVIVDEQKMIKPDAQRRLKAIEEYSQLGAGFKIALRDLEIRGAGNILGSEQSGHIAAVGYELYCQLLENAVRSVRKQPLRSFSDVTIELPWRAYFPTNYVAGERHRIDAYRRLTRLRDLDQIEEFRAELRDRFGPIPQEADNLIDLAELRILAQIWQVESVRPDPAGNLVLGYRQSRRMETLENLRKREIFRVDDKTAYVRVPESVKNAHGYAEILKRLLQPS